MIQMLPRVLGKHWHALVPDNVLRFPLTALALPGFND